MCGIEVACIPSHEIIIALHGSRKHRNFSGNRRHRYNCLAAVDLKGDGVCPFFKCQSCRFRINCRRGIRVGNNDRRGIAGNGVFRDGGHAVRDRNRKDRRISRAHKGVRRDPRHRGAIDRFGDDSCAVRSDILRDHQSVGGFFDYKIVVPFQIKAEISCRHGIHVKVPEICALDIPVPSGVFSIFTFKSGVFCQQLPCGDHRREQYIVPVIESDNILVVAQAVSLRISLCGTVGSRAVDREEGAQREGVLSDFSNELGNFSATQLALVLKRPCEDPLHTVGHYKLYECAPLGNVDQVLHVCRIQNTIDGGKMLASVGERNGVEAQAVLKSIRLNGTDRRGDGDGLDEIQI